MQMVTTVVGRRDGLRTARIGNDAVEVDDRIEGAAGPDPVIDGETPHLFVSREIALVGPSGERVLERRQRGANHLDRAYTSALDHLLVAGNNVVRGTNDAVRLDRGAGPADIVDPEQDHDMRDGWLAQHVALESCKPAHTCAIAQQAIAADALVQDCDGSAGIAQPARQNVRPAPPLASTVEFVPSVIESPNVTTARVVARGSTRTPVRKKRWVNRSTTGNTALAVKSPGADTSAICRPT